MEWNKLIQRQLKKQFGSLESVPENMLPFLQMVNDTYDHYDKDRKMLERSIELSSEEMKELNRTMRKETEENNKVLFSKLKESLSLLNEEAEDLQIGSDYLKLSYIADVLKKETLNRKSAEEQRRITQIELISVNRMFRVISQINQMIVRVTNEDVIYREACQIAVQYGKFKTAWVSLVDEKEGLSVKTSDGAIDDLPMLTEVGNDLYQEVLRTDTFYMCNDIQAELLLNDQRSPIVDLCQGSCIALPLRRFNKIVGTFNLYTEEANFFNSDELDLLIEASSDISFALDVLEKDRQRTTTEARLRSNEWRLRQAQAIAHLGSWTLDFSTGIALWSKEALKIYGIDKTEIEQSYESWLSYIHPDDLSHVLEKIKKGRENLTRTAIFHRIIRKDGIVRYLYSQSDFEIDEQGKPIGLYGVAHDITEIKEKENALRESEADLQAIFDSTSEGFVLIGLDCRVKAFNNKSVNIIFANTGREIQIGDDLNEFVHPSRNGSYDNVVGEILAGNTMNYQLPFKKANGEVKWFDFTVSPVSSLTIVTGMIITIADITERKLAEIKLVESEKRYSRLFHLSPLPMWVYDQEDLRFLDINQAAIELYGYTKKEFLAMTIKDIRPAEDLPEFENTVAKNKLKRNPIYNQSFRHQKKNGEIIQVEITSNSVLYKGKKAKVILARDITERLSYIKAIEHQNEKLKKISWLQSHVIRAPLARIMGLIPIIEDENESVEEKIQMLRYLRISAEELDEVISNISEETETIVPEVWG